MTLENSCAYGFERHLQHATFEGALEKVAAALKQEGFGILTQIDVKDTLKKKLDVDFRRYIILGACNPSLAHKALTAEPQIGLLLPCNVVVRTDGDQVIVQAIDPSTMVTLTGVDAMAPVADEAARRFDAALATVAEGSA